MRARAGPSGGTRGVSAAQLDSSGWGHVRICHKESILYHSVHRRSLKSCGSPAPSSVQRRPLWQIWTSLEVRTDPGTGCVGEGARGSVRGSRSVMSWPVVLSYQRRCPAWTASWRSVPTGRVWMPIRAGSMLAMELKLATTRLPGVLWKSSASDRIRHPLSTGLTAFSRRAHLMWPRPSMMLRETRQPPESLDELGELRRAHGHTPSCGRR